MPTRKPVMLVASTARRRITRMSTSGWAVPSFDPDEPHQHQQAAADEAEDLGRRPAPGVRAGDPEQDRRQTGREEDRSVQSIGVRSRAGDGGTSVQTATAAGRARSPSRTATTGRRCRR
jgi:hypothetical protein